LNREELLPVLFTIKYYGRAGRYQLSRMLNLGEGKVRNILRRLREQGFIEVKRGGSKLTKKGEEYLDNIFKGLGIKKIAVLYNKEEYFKDMIIVCAHLKAYEVKNVIDLRDEAVRNGAEGALIGIIVDDSIFLPPDIGYLKDYFPLLEKKVKEVFEIKEGEVVIITFSKKYNKALTGCLAVIKKFSELS